MSTRFKHYGFVIVALLFFAATNGCYYDKEELLYPNAFNCDTAQSKYSTTVLPIISASCYSCHSGNFPSGGIKLDTYLGLKTNIAKVYGAISHSSGFVPMPQSAPKLSDCNIKAVKKWMDDGALQN